LPYLLYYRLGPLYNFRIGKSQHMHTSPLKVPHPDRVLVHLVIMAVLAAVHFHRQAMLGTVEV
jgi:hypothetical protein